MSELFPESAVAMDSPKLRWLAKHGLSTRRMENGRWRCELNEETFGVGDDEEEAIVHFCIKTRLPHYNQP